MDINWLAPMAAGFVLLSLGIFTYIDYMHNKDQD
jgi:hypothetical protein